MSSDELKNKVAAALKVQPSELTADAGPNTICSWDSMGHMAIISLLDDLADSPIEAKDAEKIKVIATLSRSANERDSSLRQSERMRARTLL